MIIFINREQLFKQVHNWNKSIQLKQYVIAVEEKANLKHPRGYPLSIYTSQIS
jgi:hypothetical protein